MQPPELLLGKTTPPVEGYAPELLYPIARSHARDTLGLEAGLPFFGADVWHAYELSWLEANGRPVSRVGRFSIDANSPNIVESKSFKLYLNSLNNHRFASEADAVKTIESDLARVAGAAVQLQLFEVDDQSLAGVSLAGHCIDACSVEVGDSAPSSSLLVVDPGARVEERLFSHLLRSLCPVTGQPDWATLWIHYRGPALDHQALLRYILSYRQHQEYHEQCAERIFCDLQRRLEAEYLCLQACYTRRGGLDINPFRCSDPAGSPLGRLNRQ